MELTDKQKKLMEDLYGKGDFIESGESLLYKTNEGLLLSVDFDKLNGVLRAGTSQPPTNNKKKKNQIEEKEPFSEDLTEQQYEENYWKTTKENKLDGSGLKMEQRISKCMEATGKSREECSKEVKARMKKTGSENTNTEDIKEEEKDKEEDGEEDEEDEDEKGTPKKDGSGKDKKTQTDMEGKETICSQELDMLKQKASDYEKMKSDFFSYKEYVDKLKAKEAQELKNKYLAKIEELSKDFVIQKEEIDESFVQKYVEESKRLGFIEDFDTLLGKLIKRPKLDDMETPFIEEDFEDAITKREKEIFDRFRVS